MPKKINKKDGVFEDGLKLLQDCPVCKKKYKRDNIEVVDEAYQTYYTHLTCYACKNAVMAVIVMSPIGVSSIGVLTDLSAEDVVRIKDKSYIQQDDVLSMHEALQEDPSSLIHSLIKKV